jgi:hypothetical protein
MDTTGTDTAKNHLLWEKNFRRCAAKQARPQGRAPDKKQPSSKAKAQNPKSLHGQHAQPHNTAET